ncbi:MAG: cation-translocating P-type ATPase [Rubrobacteraceae bacterium]
MTEAKTIEAASRPARELLEEFATSVEGGLGVGEAERRLDEVGPNVLERGSRGGVIRMFLRQVNDPLMYVLLGSGALAVLLGKGADSIVVFAVVVLNTIIGFVQEYRATRAIDALAGMVPENATALRDGRWTSVPSGEVVPGDVISLASGDKVPADARLLEVRNLRVDESALTGESEPVEKRDEPAPEGAPVADRKSMVHGGTLATYGTATAVVTATGMGTELGRISSMLDEATETGTPLTRQISALSKWITIGIGVVALALLLIGILRGYSPVDAAFAGITLAVAAIPEGLPAVITIALAIGVRRMAKRSAIVRRLPAAETLGSTTVICTDKTGTLTKGEMTLRELWTPAHDGTSYEIAGHTPEAKLLRDEEPLEELPGDLRELLVAGALASDASLARDEGEWRVEGDPTEGALLIAARQAGLDEREAAKERFRVASIPFESERQYMATLNEDAAGARKVYIKGAPEVVLERCSVEAGTDPEDVLERVHTMANDGLRVLALAAKDVSRSLEELDEGDVDDGFELLGLVGMIDPPREEALEAVAECREAGVTVKMITGDHAATAAAIGRQLGLLDEGDAILTGNELDRLSDEEFEEAAARTDVFARVAPEHKLRLVKGLQNRGEVVAMTGDGVNDAPALKQAGIGTAMGIAGTDVSKEAADIVLTDDNFATITAAVEEGRRVYDNLVKALAFILPTSAGQALLIMLGVMFFPVVGNEPLLPMGPTQVLWVNHVVAVALALPLAFESKEPGTMRRPPRDPAAPILDRRILLRTALVGLLMALSGIGLFLVEYYGRIGAGVSQNAALAEAQTMAVTTVILFQVFYLIESRSLHGSVSEVGLFSNRWIYAGIVGILLLQLGFVYLPFMNDLFGAAPLGPVAWLEALAVSLIVFPAVRLEKWWHRRRSKPGKFGS